MCPPYGWAKKNQRCQQSVPLNRGTNRSVMGALTLSGLVAIDSTLGAVRRERFEAFLQHHVLPVVAPGTVLVLDNARIHHGGNLEQIVSSFGCSLLYLPPYSPELNPIELAWGYLKHLVRGQCPRTDRAREECIEQMAGRIPCPHPQAWFRKCGYYQS